MSVASRTEAQPLTTRIERRAFDPQALPHATARALGTPRPLRSAPVHWAIGISHGAGLAAIAAAPATWPWALGAMAATHAYGMTRSASAKSSFLGPILWQLPPHAAARGEVALTFDDGPDPAITPRVLDVLDAIGAKATFFCIAERVRAHPALAREMLFRGHNVENHSSGHSPWLGTYGPRRMRRAIADAQQAIADVTGVLPVLYRPPFGVRTPFTEPALARLGLHCVGWGVRSYDTVDDDGDRVARRVLRGVDAGAIVLLHDGVSIRRRPDPDHASVVEALPQVLTALHERGLRAVALRAALA